jgi:hypothetical protein
MVEIIETIEMVDAIEIANIHAGLLHLDENIMG